MKNSASTQLTHHDYSAGHPWYYLLGGDIPRLKQIQAEAVASDYCGYMAEDIRQIDKMAEPQRSERLREWQSKFREDLKRDISIYRKTVRELHKDRENYADDELPSVCRDVHTSMSLKHSHLYNDFAHLHFLEELLGKQLDLFAL